jgi:hypothetical protein
VREGVWRIRESIKEALLRRQRQTWRRVDRFQIYCGIDRICWIEHRM